MAGVLVIGNWRGRRRTPLALTLKKAKLTSPECPFLVLQAQFSTEDLTLYSLTLFEKEKVATCMFRAFHIKLEKRNKRQCFDQMKSRKDYFNTGFYVERGVVIFSYFWYEDIY